MLTDAPGVDGWVLMLEINRRSLLLTIGVVKHGDFEFNFVGNGWMALSIGER